EPSTAPPITVKGLGVFQSPVMVVNVTTGGTVMTVPMVASLVPRRRVTLPVGSDVSATEKGTLVAEVVLQVRGEMAIPAMSLSSLVTLKLAGVMAPYVVS